MDHQCTVCNIQVSRSDLTRHARELTKRALAGQGAWILTLNTEMLARLAVDPDYLRLVKRADVITADGMPVVWQSRLKRSGGAIAGRTTGVDLVDMVLRQNEIPRFAVIGGQNPRRTIEQYGSCAVDACVYVFNGRVDLTGAQVTHFCKELEELRVQLVFLALGVPKQDHLAAELRLRMPRLVLVGVGGTFEILAPDGKRSPRWMQRSGLEWAFRLMSEPKRLWRRYFICYPRGIALLIKDCFMDVNQ